MFEESPFVVGDRWGEERFVLVGAEDFASKERYVLFEDRGVTGHTNILRGDVGQPEEVVGDARSDARARWRMPPVLDIPFDELMRR